MTKSKQLKYAWIVSVLSLLISGAMLVGSTYAWFADVTVSGGNQIFAGNLDVTLVDENGEELKAPLAFQSKGGTSTWDPGYVSQTQSFRIKNNSNLALKYKIALNGVRASDDSLTEVLLFQLFVNDVKMELNELADKVLLPGETSEAMHIKVEMNQAASEKYMGMKLEGVSVTVFAVQASHESDGYGSDYDSEATYDSSTTESE